MEAKEGSEVPPSETLPQAKPIKIQGQNRNEDSQRNDFLPPLSHIAADLEGSEPVEGPDHSMSHVSHEQRSSELARSSSSSGPGVEFYMSPDEWMVPTEPTTEHQSRSSSSTMAKYGTGIIVASGGYDRNIRLWEFKTGINYRSITNKDSHVNKLIVTGDKRFIVAAGNPDIHFYGLNTMRDDPAFTYYGHTDNVTSIDLHRGGNWMVSSSEDKTVRFWDLREPSSCHQFVCPDPVNTVKLHPNEVEIFCAGEHGVVRILDLRRNLCSLQLKTANTGTNMNPSTAIKSMDIKRDGKLLVVANASGMCYVWNLRQGNEMNTECELFTTVQAHGTYITKCCFSPVLSQKSQLVTCSADKTLKLWKVEPSSVTLDKTLIGHHRWVWDCAFSRDGTNLLSSSSDSTTKLWEVSTGSIMQTYCVTQSHSFAMNCCALGDSE